MDEEELKTGSTYYYTVRAYKGSEEEALAHKYDKAYWTSFDSSGVKVVNLAIPVVSKTSTASSGIKVEWEETSGASGYAVYRKSGSAGWKMIGTSTGSSYTDKSGLKNGTEYQYTLRAYKGSKSAATSHKYDAQYWSYFDTKGMQGDYHSAPSLSSEKASGEGRYISWKAVSGASGYAVYRKVSGGDWAMFDTTTDTSYVDAASLSAGKAYYYTVRAYFGDLETAKQHKYESTYWSHFNGTGLKTVYLGIPKLTGTVTASSGIKVTWEKAAGASGYAVYRNAPGKSWGMIGTTTSTSYTDKSGLSNGDSYSYTVRSYKGSVTTAKSHKYSAQYWSSFDSKGVSGSYLKTPSLTGEKASAEGAQISWKAVSGASGYAVYRKSSTTGWSMIDTTTETSYIDTNESLLDGASYSYTVRAYSGDVNVAKQNKYDSTYWSHFDNTGIKTMRLDVPKLNSATVDGSSTSISWNKVAGASGYAVYRKPADGGWGMIGTTTSTTYVDNSFAGADSSYSYTVRAYKGNVSTAKSHKYSSQYWSGYDDDCLSVPTGNPFVDAYNFIMDWLFS